MTFRCRLGSILALAACVVRPSAAEACGCGGVVSAVAAFRSADLVFVGTVVRVDDRTVTTTFENLHLYRGHGERQVNLAGDRTDCNVAFRRSERWLVYARVQDGRVVTDKCTRTRLRSQAESSQDLAYLDGIERRRPQGVIYGEVFRRVMDARGAPALRAVDEPLQVVATGPTGKVQVTTDNWGPYQLVLPPGDFQLWVERAGRAVTERQTIHVDDGEEQHVLLAATWAGGAGR